mmetsp:Transcript_8674/g.12641  ORF Transcript_8674/g.12641 Transcript_8674/m.12641 type:complete len:99 (+) Transcript_8674:991-1287(+)
MHFSANITATSAICGCLRRKNLITVVTVVCVELEEATTLNTAMIVVCALMFSFLRNMTARSENTSQIVQSAKTTYSAVVLPGTRCHVVMPSIGIVFAN